MRYQIIIVGAGPAGCAAAIRLAQRGIEGVLLVDRDCFPRDKTCGSALSPNALRVLGELGVREEVKHHAYPIRGLYLGTPGGRRIRLASNEVASVLLRKYFDNILLQRARSLGVEFRDRFHVVELLRERGRVAGVRSQAEEIISSHVLCADGAYSLFSVDARPKETISTVMGWWEDFPFEPGMMEMIFDRNLSPLYGWMFPETPSRVNIGICIDTHRLGQAHTPRNIRQIFQTFLNYHYSQRLANARPLGQWKGHPISFTTSIRSCTMPGALLLGEAARLTHNLTGEGIYQAMQSGIFAAECTADVLLGSVPEAPAHKDYLQRCRHEFTVGLLGGKLLRMLVQTPLLDALAALYNRPRIRKAAAWAIGSALAGSQVVPQD